MWEPRRLTTLWAFRACYRDSFTLPSNSLHKNCLFVKFSMQWKKSQMMQSWKQFSIADWIVRVKSWRYISRCQFNVLCVWCYHIQFFRPLSLFWKNRVGLWDHVAVCVCVSMYPPIVVGQRLRINPPSLLGSGSVKILLWLLGNGSVEMLPR
jgi:hypothetical protein